MNVGDRVRVIKGTEEGVVTQFLANNIVEIEIEDGFTIHVLKNELALISSQEAQIFGAPKREVPKAHEAKPVSKKPTIYAQKGVYLAYMAGQTHYTRMHLINNTDMTIAYSLGKVVNNTQCHGLKAGVLAPRSHDYITDFDMDKFEQWPALKVQLLYHHTELFTTRLPLVTEMRTKAATFYRNKKTVPVIEREGFLLQVDVSEKPVQATELREQLMGDNKPASQPAPAPKKVVQELDLHINQLRDDYQHIPKDEILDIQLAAMEQHLDQAVAAGVSTITFIHGVGNYKLRDEIHRRLGKNEFVDYYQDARKEKFGYGATEVKIK